MHKKFLLAAGVAIGLGIATYASAQSEPAKSPAASATDAAMQGYYGNSAVMRNQDGKVIEVIYYRPDGTLRQWRDMWAEGPWVLNSGQDSSTICKWQQSAAHLAPTAWCHAFAPNRQVGDHWVMPENKGGHPEVVGGISVAKVNGKWVIPNAAPNAAPLVEIWSLEKGLVLPTSVVK